MLHSACIAIFRAFTRHPLYAVLNLLGLAGGIAVFITLSLLYHFETSYETWTPEQAHIYEMGVRMHFPGMPDDPAMVTMGGLLEELKTAYPQTDGTRTMSDDVIVHRGANVFNEHVQLVDGNFLAFFRMPIVSGTLAGALSDPSRVVLSVRIARKYFGTTEAVGRSLTLSDEEGEKTYTVSAVIADLPKNSDLRLDMLRLLTPQRIALTPDLWHHWGTVQTETYLKFRNPTDAQRFAALLPAFTDRQVGNGFGPDVVAHKALELVVVPLADVHLMNPKDKAAILSLGMVGCLALALALINYVNLATARAGLRAREVAVRKTAGASPASLRLQFLVEAVLTMLLAFLLALSTVELSLPLINQTGGLFLSVDYRADAGWILALLGCVIGAGLVSALYPAVLLSAFRPAQVLASSRTPNGGRMAGRLRTGLAVVQFTAVVVGFILMAGFALQIRHMQTADLGFRRDSLMIVNSLRDPAVTPAQREAFITAARAVPAVRHAALATAIPGDIGNISISPIIRPGRDNNLALAPTVNIALVGPGYFDMMGTRLLAGRPFDAQYGEDQMMDNPAAKTRITSVIISRRAARDMGFASPQAAIAQMATMNGDPVRIVGVVEDMRLYSPNDAIPPRLYLFDTHGEAGLALVRYQGASEPAMRATLDLLWRQVNPGVPFDVTSAVTNLDTYYKPERDRSHLFSIGTCITALIGCVGLYGMAAFNASRRRHEIGIRKVLGASRGKMVRLLLVQFLRPVAVAGLVAWPIGWLALHRWLGQFDDAIRIPLWLFPLASAAALMIALMTVGSSAFAAAHAEPGKALRDE